MKRRVLFWIIAPILLSYAAMAGVWQTPTIALKPTDGLTVYKSNKTLRVDASSSSTAGLRSLSLSGGYQTATAYPQGAKSCTVGLTFFIGYYPPGEYKFLASAVSMSGAKNTKTITLHLKP